MKTRNELIFDFMIALAANPVFVAKGISEEQTAYAIMRQAEQMADVYLEIV